MAEEGSEVEIAVVDKSPAKERKKPREKSPYRPEDDEVKEIKDVSAPVWFLWFIIWLFRCCRFPASYGNHKMRKRRKYKTY
jgi:hypothetical protein